MCVHGAKKATVTMRRSPHKPKCLQKSLKLYKWDISVT